MEATMLVNDGRN